MFRRCRCFPRSLHVLLSLGPSQKEWVFYDLNILFTMCIMGCVCVLPRVSKQNKIFGLTHTKPSATTPDDPQRFVSTAKFYFVDIGHPSVSVSTVSRSTNICIQFITTLGGVANFLHAKVPYRIFRVGIFFVSWK